MKKGGKNGFPPETSDQLQGKKKDYKEIKIEYNNRNKI